MDYTRATLSRRHVLTAGAALAATACSPRGNAGIGGPRIWGPPAGPSIILALAAQDGLLQQAFPEASIAAWRSPDELRAGLTSGSMQISVMPLNTAANLYNRGQDIRLFNIMTRGLLYIVSDNEVLSDIPSLAGLRLAVPYRKDAPDIILRRLLDHHGLDPDSDLTVRATGSPVEATQLLLTGQVDAAFVPEPAVSAVIAAASVMGRRLERKIDVQSAWQDIAGSDASLPQAGLAVLGQFHDEHADEFSRFGPALVEATRRTLSSPGDAAHAAASTFHLPAPIIEASIPHSNLVSVSATQARDEVQAYFSAIHTLDTDILGGRLPDDGFYL